MIRNETKAYKHTPQKKAYNHTPPMKTVSLTLWMASVLLTSSAYTSCLQSMNCFPYPVDGKCSLDTFSFCTSFLQHRGNELFPLPCG